MTEKKLTKKDYFRKVVELATENGMTDLVDFANHEIELLENKSNKKTETKTQKENVAIMETIVETLTDLAKPVRITDLQSANETLANLSNQKISALLKKLVDSGKVAKTIEKKIAFFSIM